MDISLCMIVKNEEKHLDKCLESAYQYVDEIIIIDTESTDNSKKIASKYTDKIYDFKWCDDFSKARNYSISKATNDWILVLDADEIVMEFDLNEIQRTGIFESEFVGRVKRVNSFEEDGQINYYEERVNRFFNKDYFHYEGIIHEQIVRKNALQYKTVPINVELDHIGYMNELITSTNKLERNITLLKRAILKTPGDDYLYYQLGKSYYKLKDYKSAKDNFAKAIEYCDDYKYDYTEDLVESYGHVLLKCGDYKSALSIERFEKKYSDAADFYFVLGLIYMNNTLFDKAIKCFEECLNKKVSHVKGTNSYQAYYNIGVIHEVLGRKEEAITNYFKCGNYQKAQERIIKIIERLIESGDIEKGKVCISKGIKIYNDNIQLYSMQAVIEMIEKKYKDAEDTLLKAMKIDDENIDILYNLGYLYENTERPSKALTYYQKLISKNVDKDLMYEVEEKIDCLRIIR